MDLELEIIYEQYKDKDNKDVDRDDVIGEIVAAISALNDRVEMLAANVTYHEIMSSGRP